MASLPVIDKAGKEVGKYEIDPAVFAESINKQLLHDAVVMYQANKRQGTHKTKSRAEVAGSKTKMYRQKGTGRARAGSKRSNIRRGGGHAFAKRNRDYGWRMPRKALQLAARMAMAGKIQSGQVVIVDGLKIDAPKTKEVSGMIKALGLCGKRALITTAEHDVNVYKSARNIQGVSVSPASDLNAWSILRHNRLLVTREAMDQLKEKASASRAS